MRKFCVLFLVISWVIMLLPACSDESDTSSDLDGDTDSEFLEMEEEFENGISDGNEIDGDEDFTETETDISSGEFGLLTYNVAGLPEGLSSSNPEVNIPQISPMLNAYDIVLVQEDFWYHELLIQDLSHPYQSEPMWEEPDWLNMGDGLNRFSIFEFGEVSRVTWVECNGDLDCASDCMTTKGFSMARTKFPGGLTVDIYNLHMDAGRCDGDYLARDKGMDQMIDYIKDFSEGNALLVAGDFNLHSDNDADVELLERLMESSDLTELCRHFNCGGDYIDRILFRSSESIQLEPLLWERPEGFIDVQGEDLSDHRPVLGRFTWSRID